MARRKRKREAQDAGRNGRQPRTPPRSDSGKRPLSPSQWAEERSERPRQAAKGSQQDWPGHAAGRGRHGVDKHDARSRETTDRGMADRSAGGRDDRAHPDRDRHVKGDRGDDGPSSDRGGPREPRRVESRSVRHADERMKGSALRVRSDKDRAGGQGSHREERGAARRNEDKRAPERSTHERKERAPSPDVFDRWDGGLPDHVEVSG